MSSDEEWANGWGCFNFVPAPAAVLTLLLALVWRGRRRG